MASGNFILGVSAQITNLNDVQNQLKNLKLVKSISVPVELKNGQQAIKTVNTFKDKIGQTVREVKTFNTTTGKTSSEIKSVSLNIEKANKALNPFSTGLSNLLKTGAKVAVFSVLTAGIMAVRNAFASTIDIIKDFDSSLTELKKVTTLRGKELIEYSKQLSELGDSVSRTASEMVQSATIFKKSGFSEQDSAMLAQISARFQNVVDSEMSADDAANILMSTMKGFGLVPKDVSHIADAINETADTSAVSSTDIANGLANVASVSKTMGNSLEESIGMLTAMVEITQSAGKSSRGLRQIMTRLTQTLEESSSTGKKLRETYANLGIEIYDQQGQLKSTFQILNALSPKWNEMSENEQKTLALTSAGSNQINNFTALMDNWGKAIDATTTALTSDGSAMRQNEAYMESLSAKTNNLKKAFSDLVLGDGGLSNFIKSIVDTGTAVLKFANSDLGQLILKVTAFTLVIINLKKAFTAFSVTLKGLSTVEVFDKIVTSFTTGWGQIGVTIVAVTALVWGLQKAYDALYPSIQDANEALQESRNNYESAKAEADGLEQKITEVKQRMDDIRSKGKLEITDENQLKMLEKETAELRIQLGLMRQKEAASKAELYERAQREATQGHAIEYQDIDTLRQTQRSIGSGETAQFKEYGVSTISKWTTAAEAVEIYANQMEKAQKFIEANNKQIDVLNDQLEYGGITVKEYESKVGDLNNQNEKALEVYNDCAIKVGDYRDVTQEVADAHGKGAKEAEAALDKLAQVTSVSVEATNATEGHKVVLKNLDEELENNNEELDENAQKQEELAKKNEALNASLSSISKAMKPIEKAQKEFAKNSKITADTIIGIQSKAQKLGLDFTNLMGVLSDTDSTTQDVNDAFGSMIQQIVEASGAFDNLTEENADTVESLLEGYGVTNAYTIVQNKLTEQLVESTLASEDFKAATMDDVSELQSLSKTSQIASQKLFEYVNAKIRANEITIQTDGDITNLIALANAAGVAAEKVAQAKAAVATVEKYNSKKEVLSRATSPIKSALDTKKNQEYKDAFNTIKEIKEGTFFEADSVLEYKYEPLSASDFIVNATNSGGGSGSSGGSGGKAKDPVKEAKKQRDEILKVQKDLAEKQKAYNDHRYKNQEISFEEHHKREREIEQKYFDARKELGDDYYKEYNEWLDAEIEWQQKRFEDSIKYQQHLIDRQVKALEKAKKTESDDYEEQIDRLEEKRDKIVDALDEEIDLREEQKDAELDAIKEEQDAIKKKHDEVINNLKDQIDILKEEKSANKEAWDERIAQLDAVNDELEKQKQLEEKLEALAKARATRVKVFKNGRFVYDVDREAVSEAQKNLNEYKEKLRQERAKKSLQDQRDAEQKNYEERIDALEKYKDQQDKYYDEIEKRLDDNYDAVEKKYKNLIDALKKQRDSEKKLYDDKIKNLQKLKKEQEKEYQDMIDDLNDLKDSYSDALEDMENVQNGFLDATKAFTYDYSKSMEENLKAFMEYVTGVKDGYKELEQAKQEYKNGLSKSERLDESVDSDDYTNIKNYSDPSQQHEAWEKAGSPSSSSYSVPSGDSRGSTSSLADKYGGIVTERTVRGHASGIASVGSNEFAVVGENPNKEIVVGSRLNNGTFMSLNRGTGVINAKSTRTLAGLVNSIGGSNNLIDRNTSVVQTFSFDKIVLPNVTNANSFVDALSHEFNNRAIQYGNIRR